MKRDALALAREKATQKHLRQARRKGAGRRVRSLRRSLRYSDTILMEA